jgi:beta-glucosidase
MGWYLGQEAGNAFADVLFGRVAPGGKLAVTMPRSVGELPVFYDHHRSAAWNHYLESETKGLYPFGHGLSYTSFAFSPPRLSRDRIAPADAVEVAVDVTNTGRRAGDEVVQLYIRDEYSSAPRPVLQLRHFQRISLAPGESRTVRFRVTPDDLAFWDIAMKWTVEPGTFAILTGPSSAALQSVELTVA